MSEFWFSDPVKSLGSYLEDSNMGQFLGDPFQLVLLENGENFPKGTWYFFKKMLNINIIKNDAGLNLQ